MLNVLYEPINLVKKFELKISAVLCGTCFKLRMPLSDHTVNHRLIKALPSLMMHSCSSSISCIFFWYTLSCMMPHILHSSGLRCGLEGHHEAGKMKYGVTVSLIELYMKS